MPRPPKVDHVRKKFVRRIASASKLYDAVQLVGGIHPGIRHPTLHTEHVRQVVELAFMGVVESWEEFLESTFVRYLAGARCAGGYAPNLRLGKAESLDHARQLVSGDPRFSPATGFISLRSPKSTMDMAEVFFRDGNPYTSSLRNAQQNLNDAFRLRNRVAHSSSKSLEDFKKAARRLRNNARLRQGFGVGHLLMDPPVAHFSQHQGQPTIFHAYMATFDRLAAGIVPP